jgi:hypothetical protein
VKRFDIFRRLPDGSPLWVEAAETLEEAKKRIKKLANSNGHFSYFIHDFRLEKEVWAWPTRPHRRIAQRCVSTKDESVLSPTIVL